MAEEKKFQVPSVKLGTQGLEYVGANIESIETRISELRMLSTKMKAQLQCREELFQMMDTWDVVYLLTKSDYDDFIPMCQFYIGEGGRRAIVEMMSTIGLSKSERDDIKSEVQTIGGDLLLSVEEEAYEPSEPASYDHWTTSKERELL